MKKSILGLALTLISALSFACAIDPVGYCPGTGQSYFITRNFSPDGIYAFVVEGDTIGMITTNDVVKDSLFSLKITPGTEVLVSYSFRQDTSFYVTSIAADYTYAGCGALPVRISNFYVQKKNDNTIFSFNAGNESGIKYYNIKGSVNGKDFVIIDKVIATGANHYSILVPNKKVLSIVITAFIFLAFKEDKKYLIKKYKGWIGLILVAFVVFFYSCKKEDIRPTSKTSEYKIFKVEAMDFSDKITDTQTTTP